MAEWSRQNPCYLHLQPHGHQVPLDLVTTVYLNPGIKVRNVFSTFWVGVNDDVKNSIGVPYFWVLLNSDNFSGQVLFYTLTPHVCINDLKTNTFTNTISSFVIMSNQFFFGISPNSFFCHPKLLKFCIKFELINVHCLA